MKKSIILYLILTLIIAVALAGCGGGNGGGKTPTGDPPANEQPKHGTNYYLYVASNESNTVSTFSIDPTNGVLTGISGSSVSTNSPVSLAADPSGKFLYVANLSSNSISIYSINAATGVLSPIQNNPFSTDTNPKRIFIDPSGNFLAITYNSKKKITIFLRDNVTGALTNQMDISFDDNKSPKAVAFDQTGSFLFVAVNDETTSEGSIWVYSKNASSNTFTQFSGPVTTCQNPHLLAIGPDGNFLYVLTTNSSTSVYIHSINNQGSLGAAIPYNLGQSRSLIIDGNFLYLANGINGVSLYSIAANGLLSIINTIPLDVSIVPDSLVFDPTKKFLYMTGWSSNYVWGFSKNPADGKLTEISGGPLDNGAEVSSIVTVKTLY